MRVAAREMIATCASVGVVARFSASIAETSRMRLAMKVLPSTLAIQTVALPLRVLAYLFGTLGVLAIAKNFRFDGGFMVVKD